MLDYNLIFDGTAPNTGVAITVSAASSNVIDLIGTNLTTAIYKDIGAGIAYIPEIHVDVLTAFTAAGAATLQIELQVSATAIFTTPYGILDSPVYTVASLVLGARLFRYTVPPVQLNVPAGDDPPRYMRLYYTVATGPMTAGAVFSYMNVDRDERVIYPKNYIAA